MTIATFPINIFKTQRKFDDYAADDMRFGDMSEMHLKNKYRLINVSNIVDPYSLTRLTPFNNPQSRFSSSYGNQRGHSISAQECAQLLFSEMQVTSLPYACIGPYKHLINQMILHLQKSSGMPFNDFQLDNAYHQKILNDNSQNSTKLAIQKTMDQFIDYQRKGFPLKNIDAFRTGILDTILPKFNSPIMDRINGMGITIHDVHATSIDVLSLEVNGTRWRSKVKFMGQDHFGLDTDDILNKKFRQFQFFKIWFMLQRFNRFGFRPFLTNMEAIIDMDGGS